MKTIDVSHHNGIIKWPQVAKTVGEVFIKATEGASFIDPRLRRNASGAHQEGIKVGYYHFATLNSKDVVTDAKIEAKWFLAAIGKLHKNSLPLVLDVEDSSIRIKKVRLNVALYIDTFFYQLELAGYSYMLYSTTSFLNYYLPAKHGLSDIKLWIADYNEPHFVPKGWGKIHLLQYTEKGRVVGITGNVDINRYL